MEEEVIFFSMRRGFLNTRKSQPALVFVARVERSVKLIKT